ncbi:MAG: EFR1 family ferrodoxin [Clostridia bacterium]|nr:EFR1 family ferrodoxin [Clostridia bacterium]
MQEVCIFYFSGTGMTKYVIDKMKLALEKNQTQVDVFAIENTQAQSLSLNDYDAIGIAYPVHAFNAPKIVVDFARSLPKVESLDTFVISTAGEHHWANFASSALLIKILRKKGFCVFYDRPFVMPSNFIVKDDETKVRAKISKVNAQIPIAVYEILSRITYQQRASFFAKAAAVLGRAEWFGAKCVKLFYSDKKRCDGCGLCAAKCPNRNISIQKNRAAFRWNCGLCMRCFYICPKSAIKIHRPFGFIGFDRWYENADFAYIASKSPDTSSRRRPE